MAELKSYSCPKCGSYLDVDRDRDEFECPFCGNRFNALVFHRDELLAEARQIARSGDTLQAMEKYEYLLNLLPDDFDIKNEYACAVDGIKSSKALSIDLPKEPDLVVAHERLRALLINDQRFSQGPGADYFAKLSEVLSLEVKYKELYGKYEKKLKEAEEAKGGKDLPLKYIVAVYAVAGGILAFGRYAELKKYYIASDMRATWPLWAYFLILAVLIIVCVAIHFISAWKNKDQNARYNKYKKSAEDFYNNEIVPVLESYGQVVDELEKLKPVTNKDAAVNGEDKAAATQASKSTSDLQETVTCSKCGGELILDNKNKVYICSHCGVSFDYSMFIGTPVSKAFKELADGEFDLADKRFLRFLEENPGDFDANFGRILCAGKWRNLREIELNDQVKDIDWDEMKKRMDQAIENSFGSGRRYFTAFEVLLNPIRTYSQLSDKTDEESKAAVKEAENDFKNEYPRFLLMDKQFRRT